MNPIKVIWYDGTLGSFQGFSARAYMTTVARDDVTYTEVDNEKIIVDATSVYCHSDLASYDDIVSRIADRFNVAENVALGLLCERKAFLTLTRHVTPSESTHGG